MQHLAYFLFFFMISCSVSAQDSVYSMLVIEKTTYAPSSKNKGTSTDYKITRYTGDDAIDLTLESSSTSVNQIIEVLNQLKHEGWDIVSTTKDFYLSPVGNIEELFDRNVTSVASQEYLLVKEQ
uniref:DUF4177 domain-containing protein n=1 Tax=Roseihalotalea indica TaxID=2867963 RepID=A0AA49GUN4_9BACT|nr:hypothetical protein K4G66_09745 [Tunicatimonas sp. TK19036]